MMAKQKSKAQQTASAKNKPFWLWTKAEKEAFTGQRENNTGMQEYGVAVENARTWPGIPAQAQEATA